MKFISLVSSGIDSPVATYLLSRKNEDIVLVHADNRPFTDDREINKFTILAKHLKKHITGEVKALIIPHGDSLSEYKQNCNPRYSCVFCKRMLLRYAQEIANKENADAIIMGDSLGQVASQTLQNIRVIEQAIEIPIFKPLIGLDKEEIVQIAKNIDTFELSILPSDGCSAVPDKPSTRAKLDDILAEEQKISIDKLVFESVNNIVEIEL